MEMSNIVIAHPKTEEEVNTLKVVMQALKIRFEISKEGPYDPLFVDKVMESRQQVRKGKTKQMELSAIWN
jgi:hypothetical protein